MEETSEELLNFSISIDFSVLIQQPAKIKPKKLASCGFRQFKPKFKSVACFSPANRYICLLFVRYENFALYHNKKSFFVQIVDVAMV